MPFVEDGTALGASDLHRDLADELFERGHCRGLKTSPGNAGVRIDVRDRVSQLFGMFLGPFGGPDQAFLFPIPAAKVHGAAGLPPLRQQGTDTMHSFQHGHCPAAGIDRSEDPRIAVISGHHPLIGKLAAGDLSNHVPYGAFGIIHLQPHVHLDQSRAAHVVAERQGALPLPGRHRAAHVFQHG